MINCIGDILDLIDLKNEKWAWISGWDGIYMVSNIGRVKSLEREVDKIGDNGDRVVIRKTPTRILRQSTLPNGYKQVCLYREKAPITVTVHRLVCLTFIENKESKPIINHINGIKTDNRVENLEWCTKSENYHHAVNLGLAWHRRAVYSI